MKWLKRIAIGIGVLAALLALGATYLALKSPKARPLTDRRFEATPERLERGRYLAEGMLGCVECHSERDWTTHGAPVVPGKKCAGVVVPPEMLGGFPGRLVRPNITPDPETGVGRWTDDALARAIREGVDASGRALVPEHPYPSYRGLPDEDLASLVVYLRALPPVRNALPPTDFPAPLAWMMKFFPEPVTEPVAQPTFADAAARGAFIAKLARCADCHTTAEPPLYKPAPGMDYAGGNDQPSPAGLAHTANLTPDASGLAHYDEALFLRVLRTGNVGGRRVSPAMPWLFFGKMSDEDLKALWAFLRALKPVAHDVERLQVPELKSNPDVDEHFAASVP